MSSVEKKQAIVNGVFGTAAGLLMGGPAGAAVAGLTAVGLIHSQEKHDEELRRREAERKASSKYDNEKEYEHRKARDAQMMKEYAQRQAMHNSTHPIYSWAIDDNWEEEKIKLLSSLMIYRPARSTYSTEEEFLSASVSYYMRKDPRSVRLTYDYERNITTNGNDKVDFKERPYVNVIIFRNALSGKNGIYSASNIPRTIGKGMLFERDDFLRRYKEDKDNPNIELFNFSGFPGYKYHRCAVFNGGERAYGTGPTVKYLYTIDGRNYIIG